jgi:hypothetical protein
MAKRIMNEQTPEEIKNELVKKGFVDDIYGIVIEIENCYFRYTDEGKLFIVHDLNSTERILIENPTIERIQALVFGLTGERI